MRNQTNGGIFAHVTLDGTRGDSDTNTETNALVILGMTSVQNRIPEFPSRAVLAILLAMVLTISALSIRSQRRKTTKHAKGV